eukprot:5370607-Amphidinium_carterae.1
MVENDWGFLDALLALRAKQCVARVRELVPDIQCLYCLVGFGVQSWGETASLMGSPCKLSTLL